MKENIELVKKLADELGVSFSLHYHNSDGTWFWEINSAANSECFIGRNRHSLNLATEEAIEHLEKIKTAVMI